MLCYLVWGLIWELVGFSDVCLVEVSFDGLGERFNVFECVMSLGYVSV